MVESRSLPPDPGHFVSAAGPTLSGRAATLRAVDADQPLKALFRHQPEDLLHLIGEAGARVLSTRVVELPATKRTVDTVLRLRRGRETYLRHVEFEMRYRRRLEVRLFEYATRLRLQLRLPVVTTVVLLKPPAPPELTYREAVRGRIVCERRFDLLKLWELDPKHLLALGPGPAALVGRASRARPRDIRAAARLILRSRSDRRHDLLYVLQALCGERYTARELSRLIPRGAVMASGMFAKEFRQARAESMAKGIARGMAKGIARGRARGQMEGRVTAAREACLEIVRHVHPRALVQVGPVVAACDSPELLNRWAVAAARLPTAELIKLVGGQVRSRAGAVVRGRAPRPARHSRRRAKS